MARHVVTRALPGFTLPPMDLPQSRIKDPALADALTAEELEWQAEIMPVTEAYRRALAGRDYRGRTIACWQHITPDFVAVASALTQAGASIVMGACNVDSTDDRAAACLSRLGVSVLAWSGMDQADYRRHLEIVSGCGAEFLSDMGGELIEAVAAKDTPVTGALEATTTGIHRLAGLDLGFPVFDWNDIRLKDGLHNRFHVGDAVWPAFSKITGMSLFGRRVLVIGFGPVGRGVAQRAVSLGARVSVAERDPVRLLEAQHFGCDTVALADGLAACQIVVTATGVADVLCEAEFAAGPSWDPAVQCRPSESGDRHRLALRPSAPGGHPAYRAHRSRRPPPVPARPRQPLEPGRRRRPFRPRPVRDLHRPDAARHLLDVRRRLRGR